MARPARRWRGWVLSGSLLLNAFLLAHAAVPLLVPHRRPGLSGMVDRLARDLPAADADRLRAAAAAAAPALEAERRGADLARANLSRAIAQTPYDPALAALRMTEWQDRLHAMAGRFGAAILVAVPDMSADGRARLADAADHPAPPGPPPPP